MAPVPGQPGMGTGIMSKAVFIGEPVLASEARTMTIPPLKAGTYVLQMREMPMTFLAALVVS